jgi:hypothetical protein
MNIETVDLINGLLEAVASVATGINIVRILIDKTTKGITVFSQVFYYLWSIWNVYFYFTFQTSFSFLASISLALASTIYIILVIYYKYFNKKK